MIVNDARDWQDCQDKWQQSTKNKRENIKHLTRAYNRFLGNGQHYTTLWIKCRINVKSLVLLNREHLCKITKIPHGHLSILVNYFVLRRNVIKPWVLWYKWKLKLSNNFMECSAQPFAHTMDAVSVANRICSFAFNRFWVVLWVLHFYISTYG